MLVWRVADPSNQSLIGPLEALRGNFARAYYYLRNVENEFSLDNDEKYSQVHMINSHLMRIENILKILDFRTEDIDIDIEKIRIISNDFKSDWENLRSFYASYPLKSNPQRTTKYIPGIMEDNERLWSAFDIAVSESKGGTAINALVPNQQLGPVQFGIVSDVLRIHHQPAHPLSKTEFGTASARSALLTQCRDLIDDLAASNFDKRLVRVVERIGARLTSVQDIVALGVDNFALAQLINSMVDQLPDSIAGLAEGLSRGISGYVAQFEEWQSFTDNAAAVEYEAADVDLMRDIGQDLLEKLHLGGPNVAPEVAEALSSVLEGSNGPRRILGRAGMALYRTVENLISSILREGYDLFSDACKEARAGMLEGVKDGAKTITKAGLYFAAMQIASQMAPVAAKVGLQNWWQHAAEYIVKKMKE